MDPLRFALLGLGAGSVYALAAQGIVLVYRGSGVLNFANGAIGMVTAFIFYDLRGGPKWPIWLCFVVTLVLAAVLGTGIYVLIMRPLRNAAGLSRLIAALGILALLQAIGTQLWGNEYRTIPSILPSYVVTPLSRTPIGVDRFILLGIALGLTGLLSLVYRQTKFGLATSAVAENQRATAALGKSPSVIAAVNWATGGVLSSIAAILIVNETGLEVTGLTLLVIPALAAAMLGGFASFPLTLVGGLLIGIAQSEMARYVTSPGWSNSVPFLAIIAILIVRGRVLPQRGESAERPPRLGTGQPRPAATVLAVAISACLILFVFSASWIEATITTLTVGLVVLSLVVVTGFAGQLSLAQFALAGMGGWAAARAVVNYGTPFWLALVIGIATAVPIGVAVGLPALRARGTNLAVATLGLALVIEALVFNNAGRTGGIVGTRVGSPHLFGLDFGTANHGRRYALLSLILLVLVALAVANVRRGRVGRRLVAVRTNERAATALGISVVGAKLYAFGLSAAIAGLGGVLIAFRNPYVRFDQFDIFNSIDAVLLAVIGGVGYVMGGFLGGAIAPGALFPHIFDTIFGSIESDVAVISAALLLVVVVTEPDGLANAYIREISRLVRLVKRSMLARERAAPRRPNLSDTAPASPKALEVSGLTVRFGGVIAVDKVSLSVRPGEIVGLIGPNGAGKTTLIDAISGIVHPSDGSLRLDDQVIDDWSGVRRARAGLARTFQSLELFESMTVWDNLRAASDNAGRSAYFTDLVRPGNPSLGSAGWSAVDTFGLVPDLEQRPEDLPFGKRRLVAIARAVANGPSILLLDEPAAGLHDAETAELGEVLRSLAHRLRIGILLVEHDVPFVFGVCDRIVALDGGRKIAEGTPDEIGRSKEVIDSYLGQPPSESLTPKSVAVSGNRLSGQGNGDSQAHKPLIAACRLSVGYGQMAAVRDLDLDIFPGEVVALLGPNGAGKSTTILALAGELPPLSGNIRWSGGSATTLHGRAREGLALVTEERSVFMGLTTSANLALGQGRLDSALELFPELVPLLKRKAGLLSGGEQQMLTLSRALAAKPRVLLADELSLGLSPLVVDRLLRAVRQAADAGAAVLLVEQHAHRALDVADRAIVLNRGRVVLQGRCDELRERGEDLRRSYLQEAAEF